MRFLDLVTQYTPSQMKMITALQAYKVVWLGEKDYRFFRPGEFSHGGIPKQYIPDILLPKFKHNDYKGASIEVEGKGSASKDNPERDRYFDNLHIMVFHIPNKMADHFAMELAAIFKVFCD
jgi:hypothetical protein